MIRKGDTVRYLSEVGGGVVTRVDGKIAYVDDDGFERPVAINELVVVLPAGHEQTGAKLMFDQQAFDIGKTSKRNKDPKPAPTAAPANPAPVIHAEAPVEEEFEIEETEYGDAMNVSLAFEPSDIKHLDNSSFNVALVNDSNYFLFYQLLVRASERGEWETFAMAEVAPNEIADLRRVTRDDLPTLERIIFQAVAYKKEKPFAAKEPLNVLRKLDLTKFFKLHCFRPGLYFESPVLEIPLIAEPLRTQQQKNSKNK